MDFNLSLSNDDHLDHDTSHDSNLTNNDNEVSTAESLHRSFGEAAARGAKVPFIPISEDTVYLDTVPQITDTDVCDIPSSSPHSMDSWINYSSNSSEDYSYTENLKADSNDADVIENNKSKRCCQQLLFGTDSDEDNVDGNHDDDSRQCDEEHILNDDHQIEEVSSKRLRGKDDGLQDNIISISSTPLRRKSSTKLSRSSSIQANTTVGLADIRMIDFAHTTFVAKNGAASTTQSKVHVGPDNGFLHGLASLKTILTEILVGEEN